MTWFTERKLITGGFLLALLVFFAVRVASHRSIDALVEEANWVAHTHEVLQSLVSVENDVAGALSSQRGFILSGDESILESYDTALGRLPQEIERLRKLTSDNARRQRQLDTLEPLIARQLEGFRRRVAIRQSKGFAAAVKAFNEGRGWENMKEIRQVIAEMTAEEETLLRSREAASLASARQVAITTWGGTGVTVALLLAVFYFLNQQVDERRRAELAQREINKELEAFTYSVSHDLRAPLRHIDGFSQILMQEYGPQLDLQAKHYLQRVREGAQHMGHLVDDLLNLSRVGRGDLNLQLAGLNTIVEEALRDLKPETDGRKIEWQIARLPFAECDAGLIKQVFVNLLSNALKYTRPREKTEIEVGQKSENGQTVIFVRDNGVGFNMKYADKLFGIFQRLHRQEDFEGTGVGLATVQRIIARHGGRVWAESELDKGATFYFALGQPVVSGHKTNASSPTLEVSHD